METRLGSSVRLIAPAALIAFGIALMIVVATGGTHHKGSANQPTKGERRDLGLSASGKRKANAPPPQPTPNTPATEYVGQTGDTPGAIARKTSRTVHTPQQ